MTGSTLLAASKEQKRANVKFDNVESMDGIVSPVPKRNRPAYDDSARLSGITNSTRIGSPALSAGSQLPGTSSVSSHSPFTINNSPLTHSGTFLDENKNTEILPPMLHPSLLQK
ncbi:hypothetical protein HDV01_000842 [Terramyces sp. JEL0728]|nr:hypothetical protein HDV01_000842 [Terramyces sp. JEL0728]